MLPVYQAIIKCLSDRIGMAITLTVGDDDYRQFSECDLAFICGLTYVLRTPPYVPTASHEAFAAPIPAGARYQGQPIYYSDVIVRADSPYQHFADLRGASWAFNEPESQSGYGVTRYHLVQMGETNGFFGKVVQAGFHQTALHWVANGEIDAAAIDTLVLAVEMEAHPR
ncbi:MAG: PhnD/SsuA/transferrin family substrate-binding protein [Chloroflexota bacterium]|nr:PhnD/SsuA/transferrin family substrate-binding protein [Chloroflexota bacterium]